MRSLCTVPFKNYTDGPGSGQPSRKIFHLGRTVYLGELRPRLVAMCHVHTALFCRRKELGTVWSWGCPDVKSQAWPSANCQGPAGVAGEVGCSEFSEQVKEQHLKSLRGPQAHITRVHVPGNSCIFCCLQPEGAKVKKT